MIDALHQDDKESLLK